MPLFGEISVHDSQAVYLGTPMQVVVLTHVWWTDQGHWKTRMHPSPTSCARSASGFWH